MANLCVENEMLEIIVNFCGLHFLYLTSVINIKSLLGLSMRDSRLCLLKFVFVLIFISLVADCCILFGGHLYHAWESILALLRGT